MQPWRSIRPSPRGTRKLTQERDNIPAHSAGFLSTQAPQSSWRHGVWYNKILAHFIQQDGYNSWKNLKHHWMQHFTLVTKQKNILCVTTDCPCNITRKNQTPWKIQCFINTYEKQLLRSNLDLCPNFSVQLKMRVLHAEGTTPNIQMQKMQQHWCT